MPPAEGPAVFRRDLPAPGHLARRVLGFVTAVALGCGSPAPPPPAASPVPTVSAARHELNARNFSAARQIVREGLARGASPDLWRTLLAEIEFREGNTAACRTELERLPSPPDPACAPLLDELGQRCVEGGHVRLAEAAYRRALQAAPADQAARVNLGYLLGFEGRCFEAAPHHFAAVTAGYFTLHHLVLLGAADPVIDDAALRTRALRAVPTDLLPRLGEARTALRLDRHASLQEIVPGLLAADPECAEAQGLWGRFLASTGADQPFAAWQKGLPSSADTHPEVWMARGLMARRQGELAGAVRCFWEAARRDPNHRLAHFQLGQVLVLRNRPFEAQPFLDRATRLQQLAEQVDELFRHPDDVDRMRLASQHCEELGRIREAWAWAGVARQIAPQSPWAGAALPRLAQRLRPDSPQVEPTAAPAGQRDYSTETLPQFVSHDRQKTPALRPLTALHAQSPGTGNSAATITFEDQAAATGLQFVYHGRGRDDRATMRMYETTGGGVAAFDYDGDRYPDLYFTQAGSLSLTERTANELDRCFRNRAGTHWQDVTLSAGLRDVDYGQGVTAGDFDNDGFPDLYVANLGRNRLYHNQGDGTFRDVTETAGLATERWTTSGLIADLNGDGHPDLYDVNYLSHEDAIRATCQVGDELRWCSPDAFAAEQDQFFLSRGDGTFRDVTTESGIERPNGKGMGIVAADFDNSSRLSLFIANDNVPNFFFENRSADDGVPQFEETATLNGLAFDGEGLPQACMGVAAGDMNGDQQLDLFVTNFYEQSNTLYLRGPGLAFEDATRSAGLREPSWLFLGFGTQCLDADLDGWSDLVVANGHVLDLSSRGVPFRMRSQFFHNSGAGRFAELPPSQLGPPFQREFLGRGLARLDWNRDGLSDFVVSNIEAPALLATNRTPQPGRSITLRLIGTQRTRDPLGAQVTLRAGSQTWTQQLTGGDGYQCRNENTLIFGVGSATQIDSCSIRWPSGVTTEHGPLLTNSKTLIIEGGRPGPGGSSHGVP